MYTFKEFVQQKEASWNPLHRDVIRNNDTLAAPATMAALPVGAASAAVGALGGGVTGMARSYRQSTTGNPLKSQNPEVTKSRAFENFRTSAKWITDFVAKQPQKVRLIQSLMPIFQQVEKYVDNPQNQPARIQGTGVTMGKQPTTLSNFMGIPKAIIGGLSKAAIDAWDSMNPNYDEGKELGYNVDNLIYALDAIMTINPQVASDYLQAFLGVLEEGKDSSFIDRHIM